MKITSILCEECGTTMFSRAQHDFRYCPCGNIAVDGGRDYLRFLYKTDKYKKIEIEVSQTDKELYDDWNYREDKFGCILKGN